MSEGFWNRSRGCGDLILLVALGFAILTAIGAFL